VKPLVAVDGDSFAHRAYHALPKSIRRADGGPAGLLVGIGSIDPFAFGVATVVLTLVLFVATWVPARRAAAMDPMRALRAE